MAKILNELIRVLEGDDWDLARRVVINYRARAELGDFDARRALELACVMVRS